MTGHIEIKSFDRADDRLDFKEHGGIDVLKLSDGTTGMHALFKPGWKWSEDEKPLLGNPESCPIGHVGYCISGELAVKMVETGQEVRIRKGDFFEIPPGHDAWVPGNEDCEMIFFEAADSTVALEEPAKLAA